MTPAAIIERAAGDGVQLALSAPGKIKAIGDQATVERWLPIIRANKSDVVAMLTVMTEPTERAADRKQAKADQTPAARVRRQRILAFLSTHSEVQRAVRTDISAEPDKVIATIGLRGVGTGEVEIPAELYDGFALMALLDSHAGAVLVDRAQVSTERFNERSST
jgi:hypothetical protein